MIRVGVCVGMCKYWVIILDILAYGGAKCFRGMNPSLILLTSLILSVVFLFSAHHHPPPTTHSLFTMPPDTCCHHAPQWPTTAVRASPFFWIESKQPSSTPHSLSHSLYQNDRCPCNELTVGPASLPFMESACNPTRPGRPRPRRATKTRSTGWWTAQCCRKSFPMLELCDTTMNRRGLERKQATTE